MMDQSRLTDRGSLLKKIEETNATGKIRAFQKIICPEFSDFLESSKG